MGLNVLSSLTTAAAVTLTAVLSVAPASAAPNEIPTADEALAKLMEGNARFVSGDMQHPNLSAERRAELAEGQAPYAVIVSCSDSRVPPELVFDAGPGDLFVIRVAGNIVGDDAQASIEYAVGVLKTPLVLVMGHESCGAVGAAVKTQTEGTEFPGSIHDLVETIRPSVETAMEAGRRRRTAGSRHRRQRRTRGGRSVGQQAVPRQGHRRIGRAGARGPLRPGHG